MRYLRGFYDTKIKGTPVPRKLVVRNPEIAAFIGINKIERLEETILEIMHKDQYAGRNIHHFNIFIRKSV